MKRTSAGIGVTVIDEKRKLVTEYLLTYPTVAYKMALSFVNYYLAIIEDGDLRTNYPDNDPIVIELYQIGTLTTPSDI